MTKSKITNFTQSFKIKCMLLTFLSILFFFSLSFVDLHTTYSRGILFLDSVFSGSFPHGYFFEGAFYVIIHIILAIWCIPIYPLIKFGLIGELSVFSYLWAKLLIVVLAYFIIKYIIKIFKLSDIPLDENWIFLLCSSTLFFLPFMATGQYDGIELIFAILSVYLIVKEEKLSVASILVLSLSVCTKFLFVFSALAIILLFEKRPLHIVLKVLLMMSFSILFILFSKYAFYISPETGSVELGGEFLTRLFKAKIDGTNYNTSVYFIVFFGICILAYISKTPQTKIDILKYVSWFCIACGTAFIIFVYTNPNWPIISYVFIIITFAIYPEKTRINLLLDLIYTTCMLIQHICCDLGTCYITEDAFNMLILKNVPHNSLLWENCESGFAILRVFGIETLLPAIAALGAVSLIAILIINNPFNDGLKFKLFTYDNGISIKSAEIIRLAILFIYFFAQVLITFFI